MTDIVCVSHLRWNFVYQRPQHLMSRAAKNCKVVYLEEPVFAEGIDPHLHTQCDGGVTVATPHLPSDLDENQAGQLSRTLLEGLLSRLGIKQFVLWMYTPMPLPYLGSLGASAVVYDCMDELANFRFAPPALRERERLLFKLSDLVFTGGVSLYEAKCNQHNNVYCFPSSVDAQHFAKARRLLPEPLDMSQMNRPRVGFYGVIDERMDLELIETLSRRLPQVEFVMVGPFAKIDPAELPRLPNLHFLGQKAYSELPAYLAHWDVAILPFAQNDSTRFISPTKTPEYLAAGKPVVSTPIRDVVRPYGERDLVYIAGGASDFCDDIRRALYEDQTQRQARADAFIAKMSWDKTWSQMQNLIERTIALKRGPAQTPQPTATQPTFGLVPKLAE